VSEEGVWIGEGYYASWYVEGELLIRDAWASNSTIALKAQTVRSLEAFIKEKPAGLSVDLS
jgi:hypothetical protein